MSLFKRNPLDAEIAKFACELERVWLTRHRSIDGAPFEVLTLKGSSYRIRHLTDEQLPSVAADRENL